MEANRSAVNFVFACAILAVLSYAVMSTKFSDFPEYYLASKQILAGKAAQIYDFQQQRAEMPKYFAEGAAETFDAPYALIGVAPLGLLNPIASKLVFQAVMIMLLAGAAVLLTRILRVNNRGALIVIALMVVSGPAFEILKVSKPIPIFAFAFALSLLFLQKGADWKAGMVAAFCAVRPHEILPFFILALGAQRYKFLAGALAVGLLLVLISLPIFGIDGYRNFVQMFGYLNQHPELYGATAMPTFRGQLLRMGVSLQLATTINWSLYGATLAALFFLGRRLKAASNWYTTGTIAAFILGLLTIPYVHLYDFIVLAPAFCFLIVQARESDKKRFYAIAACMAMFISPLYQLIHYNYFVLGNNVLNLHLLTMIVLTIVAVPFCTEAVAGGRNLES